MQKRVRRLLGIGTLSFLALMSSVLPAFADYAISVSCYSKDVNLGNAEVYDVRLAARVCNDVYYACKGECIGCYEDFDYMQDVCVDLYGNMYLR